jgi:hypothetical protein
MIINRNIGNLPKHDTWGYRVTKYLDYFLEKQANQNHILLLKQTFRRHNKLKITLATSR